MPHCAAGSYLCNVAETCRYRVVISSGLPDQFVAIHSCEVKKCSD